MKRQRKRDGREMTERRDAGTKEIEREDKDEEETKKTKKEKMKRNIRDKERERVGKKGRTITHHLEVDHQTTNERPLC